MGKNKSCELCSGKVFNSKTHPREVNWSPFRFQAQCSTNRLIFFSLHGAFPKPNLFSTSGEKQKVFFSPGEAKILFQQKMEQKFCWSTKKTRAPKGAENIIPKGNGAGKCSEAQRNFMHPEAQQTLFPQSVAQKLRWSTEKTRAPKGTENIIPKGNGAGEVH